MRHLMESIWWFVFLRLEPEWWSTCHNSTHCHVTAALKVVDSQHIHAWWSSQNAHDFPRDRALGELQSLMFIWLFLLPNRRGRHNRGKQSGHQKPDTQIKIAITLTWRFRSHTWAQGERGKTFFYLQQCCPWWGSTPWHWPVAHGGQKTRRLCGQPLLGLVPDAQFCAISFGFVATWSSVPNCLRVGGDTPRARLLFTLKEQVQGEKGWAGPRGRLWWCEKHHQVNSVSLLQTELTHCSP